MSADTSELLPKCTQCSLLPSSKSSFQTVFDEEVIIFLIPGVFFCTLAIRWSAILLCKWSTAAKTQALEMAGLPLPPKPGDEGCLHPGLRKLPWEGLVKVLLALFAAGFSIYQSTLSASVVIIISMYVMFLISGIVDVFLFYCGYTVLPEGIQSFILAISFSVEAICFHAISNSDTSHFIHLLLILIICCSVSSILEVVFDNRLVKFCRTFFTLLQSSWLLHLSILLSQENLITQMWSSILFIWHLSFLFIFSICALLLTHHCSRPTLPHPLPQSIRTSQSSPSGSSSQLVPCKFLKLPLGNPSQEFVAPITNNTQTMFQTLFKAEQLNQIKGPSVVDVEPWDRIHRMQYTSFQNNI